MTLTKDDKRLLYHLQYIGDKSVAELAADLKLRESTLQSKLRRWEKEQKIAQRVFINTFAVGANEVELFFTPTKTTMRAQAELEKAITQASGVRWFFRTAGKHEFILGIEAITIAQITKHLEELDAKTDGIFANREVGISIGYWWFGRKYLADEDAKHSFCLTQLPTKELKTVDDVDHRMLRMLGQKGAQSHRAIANELSIPQSTVGYRMNNLIKNQIIVGTPYLISPTWLGMLVYRLQLVFNTFSARTHKELLRWSQQHRSVVSMMRLLGPWDYTLRCEVARPDEIADLTDELHDAFGPALKECSIVSVVKELSFSYYPIELFSE
jgi:DNA-binding Lrp family transcriptional regulator